MPSIPVIDSRFGVPLGDIEMIPAPGGPESLGRNLAGEFCVEVGGISRRQRMNERHPHDGVIYGMIFDLGAVVLQQVNVDESYIPLGCGGDAVIALFLKLPVEIASGLKSVKVKVEINLVQCIGRVVVIVDGFSPAEASCRRVQIDFDLITHTLLEIIVIGGREREHGRQNHRRDEQPHFNTLERNSIVRGCLAELRISAVGPHSMILPDSKKAIRSATSRANPIS